MRFMKTKRILSFMIALAMVLSYVPFQAHAVTTASPFTLADGAITVAWSGSGAIEDAGKVSETSAWFVAQTSFTSPGTNTVTITNTSGSKAIISFSYASNTVTKNYGFTSKAYTLAKCAEFNNAVSGTYTSAELENNSSFTLTIKGENVSEVADGKMTLSDITLTPVVDNPTVTLTYDSALGSATINEVTGPIEVTYGSSVTLAAAANSGTTFVGWINAANNQIISTSASCTYTPSSDVTVKPVFIDSTKTVAFRVGTTHLFEDLNSAATYANSSVNKTVVLAADGTLPSGTHTIPSGVTLLIPFDSADTLYTTEPACVDNAYTKPTAYRTLTMADGANLVINGAMSVSAKHNAANGGTRSSGAPVGNVGFVQMNSGSTITVNNGGKLYAWGFITGSGTVTAKSGAAVYENFQVEDFRGGTQTSSMNSDASTYGVFPLSQYYVQNIETTLVLEAGASETCYTSFYFGKLSYSVGTSLSFVGSSSSMFTLTSGTLTKYYDGTTDRLMLGVDGTASISPVTMTVISTKLESKNYELPIHSGITVEIKDGSNVTIAQDICLQPGAEIIIDSNATCTLGEGVSAYIYDLDQWGLYVAASTGVKFHPLTYAPGRSYTRTEADLKDALVRVDGTLDASAGYLYTTTGGANICSSGSGVVITNAGGDTVTYQAKSDATYDEISITPAKLMNKDGSYRQSATDTYTYDGSTWNCGTHTWNEGVVNQEPTCTAEGSKTVTCTVCGATKTEAIAKLDHTDTDPVDHNCDACGETVSSCADNNSDHNCDTCGTELSSCADGNNDHNCDVCGTALSDCADNDNDHNCDVCGAKLSDCADNNNDHNCDVCGIKLSDCADNNNDHNCDVCDTELSDCTDIDNDHNCDVCGTKLSDCTDIDNDHNCDVCGTELSECADDNNDHNCDTCGTKLSDCADNNSDHNCDTCGTKLSDCADNNNDHNCDTCGTELSDCADIDNDHNCDVCGTKLSDCADNNNDHNCDTCGNKVSECADADNDHKCDVCTEVLSSCADGNNDHNCDVCGAKLSECADSDNDHNCDTCGTKLSDCADNDNDHNCDVCGTKLSDCADNNNDHNCDTCGTKLSECADDNNDHNCDTCGTKLSDCADNNNDHNCDVCGTELSECADDNNDHNCDTCGTELSDCTDIDNDHNCDVCGAELSECADTNKDHKCDICEDVLSDCTDNNSDHYCDTCGNKVSECADADNDHKCDVCTEVLSNCADGNNDHNCDVCGAKLSDCADSDNDHNCDVCGTELSECADNNNDHYCDVCGAELSECADTNKDHKCDICEDVLSDCTDNNNDHYCDTCGNKVSECADADNDHKCDRCGTTLSSCADSDNDHNCDICGDVLSECSDVDTDKDHLCDTCSKVMSECADSDNDHNCDTCGTKLSDCADNNNDHNCDVCGTELSECADDNSDGACDVCGETLQSVMEGSIRLRSAALNLMDKVCIIYKCSDDLIATDNEKVLERGVLLFDSAEKAASKDPEQAYETVLLEYDASEGRYVGQTEGIDARDMDKSQFAVAYVKMADGTYIFSTKDGADQVIEYSPLIYCKNKMNDQKMGDLCAAMMHYGAAAQVAQYGKTTGLMNEGFKEIAYDAAVLGESVFSADTTVTNGIRLRSAALDLQGAVSYIVKFTVDTSIADKQLYAEYTLLGETGSVELTEGSDGRLWATISGVPPKDLGATLRVKAYYLNDDGEKVYGAELVYSGLEYVRRAVTNTSYTDADKNLAKALAMYIYYADQYGN